MRYIIITGASRGLGRALAEELALADSTLMLVSRDKCELIKVAERVKDKGSKSFVYEFDLFNYKKINALIDEIVNSISIDNCTSLILINNAGTIDPIDKFGQLDDKEIEKNLAINCIAPIVLMNKLINSTKDMNIERRIINISSGVFNKSLFGWGLYSSSKSAVHSIVETIAKENYHNHSLKVVSIDPGVMDTNIQKVIRETNKDQFDEVELFITYYKENKLRNPKKVAEIIRDNYIDNWNATSTFEKLSKYDKNE